MDLGTAVAVCMETLLDLWTSGYVL